jgi:carbonic anhydrase
MPFLSTGPAFWGLINPQWNLCNKGRRQSPVNIDPSALLFDPHLTAIHVDKHKVLAALRNLILVLVIEFSCCYQFIRAG